MGNFVVEGATVSSGFGGVVVFDVLSKTASAGNGVFIVNGGSVSGAVGGVVGFSAGTAENATLIANSGTNRATPGISVFPAVTAVKPESSSSAMAT
jgi:hypothetical protein